MATHSLQQLPKPDNTAVKTGSASSPQSKKSSWLL